MRSFVIIFFLLRVFHAEACNLSNVSLQSLTPLGGGMYQIDMQLCVGAGITGAVLGADEETYDILFGFYGTGPINLVSFTPSITASNTGCTMDGFDVGPLAFSPYNTQANIYYFFDQFAYPSCNNGFACNNSTALCGNAASNCMNVQVVVDALPDSIRVFGVEGAGNPTAGCYPNPDMGIAFSTGLNVIWGDFTAKPKDLGIELNWSTISEVNNDHFTIERWNEQWSKWETLDYQQGAIHSSELKWYSYSDRKPISGINNYRIVQYDLDGKKSFSSVVSVLHEFSDKQVLYNSISQSLSIVNFEIGNWNILRTDGSVIVSGINDTKDYLIQIPGLSSGIYFFEHQNQAGSIEKLKFNIINY